MRLTSTGLGIGTSSPSRKLQVVGTAAVSSDFYGGYANTAANIIASSSVANGGAGFSQFLFGNTSSDSRGYLSYTHASDSILFGTTGTTKATLDSSGNLGLGVTPSAWGSGYKALQVSPNAALMSSGAGATSVNLSGGTYFDGTNWKQLYADVTAARYEMLGTTAGSSHAWFVAPNSTAGGNVTFTQAMTLDASGNLAVGTTNVGYGKLGVYDASNALIGIANSTSYAQLQQNGADLYINWNAGTASNGNLIFRWGSANTERARIDSSGNLLIGTTSLPSASVGGIQFNGTSSGNASSSGASTSAYNHFLFYNGNGIVGSISTSGSLTTYSVSSDYRLKNTIAPMTGALAKVALLKPCTYKWNADGSDGEGFIAHELAEVVPQCVTGEKDAVDEEGNPKYQGIDTSFLVATLTAALQEAVAEINQLKARLDAANL
jgi:hypothetical protein